MATVKLDRKEIEDKIRAGDNCNGHYVLAVAPDGSGHKVHWMETNRQWDPWPQGWLIIGIPALFPDGTSEEWDLAETLLKDQLHGETDSLMEQLAADDFSIVRYVEEAYPDDWAACIENAVDWLAAAFLAACNGDGADINQPTPWGYTPEQDGYEAIDPPAEFEWA